MLPCNAESLSSCCSPCCMNRCHSDLHPRFLVCLLCRYGWLFKVVLVGSCHTLVGDTRGGWDGWQVKSDSGSGKSDMLGLEFGWQGLPWWRRSVGLSELGTLTDWGRIRLCHRPASLLTHLSGGQQGDLAGSQIRGRHSICTLLSAQEHFLLLTSWNSVLH